MLLVDVSPDKFNDRDVMARLAASAKTVTKHESQRSFQHGFVGLLQTRLFVKGENLSRGGQLLVGALKETLNLNPINSLRFQFFHAALTRVMRLLCQTFSRNASFRARREENSFRVSTV